MAAVVSEKDVMVSKVSWRSLWAGLFMVAGVQVVMQLFGIAIGVSALSPSQEALQGVSLWQGSWAIISTLAAFFFGGWVASSMIAPARRSEGVLAGVVLWGFATTLGIIVVSAGLFGAIGIGRTLMIPPGSAAATQSGVAALHSGYTIGAAWATFFTILLALGCAVAGGLVGVRPEHRPREYIQRRKPLGTVEPPLSTPPVVPPEPTY
jgi:hypothetical protein